MATVNVDLAGRSYDVRIGGNLLREIGPLAGSLLRKTSVPVVTDTNVHARWGKVLGAALEREGFAPNFLIHAPGEGAKSWDNLARTVEWLLAQEMERGDTVIAFGGGVIGDLTGFAAAILKRGCGFIQIPTTLLAQVDSSVGGKTAINAGAGKNLVGAFHQPALVIADTEVLGTLPDREMRCGYAEVIKYGVLGDARFFAWCEANGDRVVAHDEAALAHAVTTSVEAKARIVAQDERETTGARALLNLGHTFGHALEAETGFSDRLLHGEAVALGMVLAARYSARRDYCSEADAQRITAAIGAVGLPTEISALGIDGSGEALAGHMLHDKKMDAGTLPFVLLRGVGEAFLDRDVDKADIAAFLDEQLQAH
ncbi:3-dehydroquinate synthase [Erythrobacter arachoides]|uniref:3-dehydroquinate synthase n=1 Tax=Aurantiacibacter arachoides TaxID=1850444 RepID=A0A844ZZT5_9SPHN|nr:3-dehydroquinate synthase [Aurantiacibacter arachoides]MXO92974.1 3-dehydroquinate synthase [Aurantiacibacter arachoides]GGD53015.1 3-dehydroquinate synthase [Aurantiacibacter arachoides]